MKGGVGKTTLTQEIARDLSDRMRVLVVDLDPQFNVSQYLLGSEEYTKQVLGVGKKKTTWDIFEAFTRTPGQKDIPVVDASNTIIHVSPAYYEYAYEFQNESDFHERVMKLRNRLDLVASCLDLHFTNEQSAGKEMNLDNFLKKVKNDYDLILIDCSPTIGVLSKAAFIASDSVLIPVIPEHLASMGLPLIHQTLSTFRAQFEDKKLEVAGIVLNNNTEPAGEMYYHVRTELRSYAIQFGWPIFESEIPYTRSFARGVRAAKSIQDTPHAKETVKRDVGAVTSEFAKRIGV